MVEYQHVTAASPFPFLDVPDDNGDCPVRHIHHVAHAQLMSVGHFASNKQHF